ncbi:hypothetical protein [Flavobacterium lacustre]|uniref:hypothetical protein n=1 Tax=Flavobacterium lacustre TaxID=3016339 RepID=UPI0022B6788D|nr:hypothetical protein [Flavobacterium lacustre]
MKIRFIIIVLLVSINIIFSQEKTVKLNGNEILTIEVPENGKVENGIYTCNLFDWKITIPENYKITDIKRTEELEDKGYEATKNANPGIKINPHPTQLIGFEKDKYTYFKSSFESLTGTKKVTLEEHKKFSEQLLSDTYSKIKELRCDISSSDIKLGKYSFYKIEIRVYNPKNDMLLLTQELYNSFINNHLFSVSINYRNAEEGMILNYAFTKSMEN